MKNKYLVINQNGEVFEPEEYFKSKYSSSDFKILIQKEVFKKKDNSDNNKSDYLKYANKMGFNWEPNSDIGFIQYDYKANLIMRILKDYARDLVNKIGLPIFEVSGSNFFDLKYPVVEAYAKLFGDRLFRFESDKNKLVMSYDASYPQFNLAEKYQLSEKQLPFAHFSISDCYRYEQSGECMLLFRSRRFNMPDLHPYFKDLNEAFKWYFEIEKQILSAAGSINKNYLNIVKVSSLKNWEDYRSQIIDIALKGSKEMLVEIKMDRQDRYWIIDVDYSFIDKLGQVREIGCIQIDVGNAERLNIKYLDKNNKLYYPIIIHSAVPGGLERFLYMIFDDYKNSFPIWLQPIQLRLLPISDEYISFCEKLVKQNLNIRINIDDRSENINKKVKLAHEELVPNIVVIGKRR